MEFNPSNPTVRRCLQALDLEEQGQIDEAKTVFQQAWHDATNDFERFIAAHHIARHQPDPTSTLEWLQKALKLAQAIDDVAAQTAVPSLHLRIAACYKEMGDEENARTHTEQAASLQHASIDPGPFYHGSKADLQVGDLLTAGKRSNYQEGLTMNHVYFTAMLNGAGLAAALAQGEGRERVYVVEPTGAFENDPNVTDKKFPGNPTRSYRTQAPLRIVGEVTDWLRQSPEDLERMRARLARGGGRIIN